MGKRAIFINNIPIHNAHIVKLTENIIVCNSIREEFFGISTILLENKEIICEHQDSIVKCSVRIDDKIYENIPFNLIIDKDAKSKIAINKNTLSNPKLFVESKKEEPKLIIEKAPTPKDDAPLKEALVKIDKKNKAIANLEKELQTVKENNQRQKSITEKTVDEQIQRKIDSGIEEYKQKLFESFFVLSEEQAQLKETVIQNTLEELKESFNRKYIKEVSEIKDTSVKEVREYAKDFLQKLSRKLNTQSNSSLTEIQETVNNTLKSDLFLVTEELQKRFNKQVDTNRQQLYEKLELHKNSVKKEILNLFENYEALNRIETDKKINKKIVETKDVLISKYIEDIEKNNNALKQEFHQHFNILDQKINKKRVEQIKFDSNELVAEAARLLVEEDDKTTGKLKKFKDQLLKDLQKAADKYTQEANRRMMRYAEMMSGGGSVAKQFAGGGTMDGDLNVTGRYLSGGVDLTSKFVNLIVDVVLGNVPAPIPGGGGGGGQQAPQSFLPIDNWNSTFTTVQTFSAQWLQDTQNITYNTANETISIDRGNTVSLSALSYRNIEDPEAITLEEFTDTFAGDIYRGYTVTLGSGKVYTFAGTDKNNPGHYLEINSNPITPIYKEALLTESELIVDTFKLDDFKSAKYNLQIEQNFDNEIYYSEINVVGSAGTSTAVASEYGQIFTSPLIIGYDAFISLNQLRLVVYFNTDPTPGRKLIIKGHRTNFYKI